MLKIDPKNLIKNLLNIVIYSVTLLIRLGGAIGNALNMYKFSGLAELNFQRAKLLDLYRSQLSTVIIE